MILSVFQTVKVIISSSLLNHQFTPNLEIHVTPILPTLDAETIQAAINRNVAVLLSYALKMGYQIRNRHRNTR